jgi:hypothetical protein
MNRIMSLLISGLISFQHGICGRGADLQDREEH